MKPRQNGVLNKKKKGTKKKRTQTQQRGNCTEGQGRRHESCKQGLAHGSLWMKTGQSKCQVILQIPQGLRVPSACWSQRTQRHQPGHAQSVRMVCGSTAFSLAGRYYFSLILVGILLPRASRILYTTETLIIYCSISRDLKDWAKLWL